MDNITESPFKGKTGLQRICNAFGYSLTGLSTAYRHENAFRQEVWLAALLIPLALFMPSSIVAISGIGKALMVASIMIVLIVELLNSAIEAAVDRVSLENHRLAARAKDIGSAAVLVSLLNVVAVWGLVIFA